ncbi:hypothetical protein B0I35DRAFT_482745 [Stachybotrys elegans]|uniref:Uncharacterized protein n=1 Tax=Stachybotrys elegans TaxID=80388 RepID=A0A8K0SLN0_9HYPO|nr:hypothetical protein B0I35DRAFT_482745 [Stachybotrys elegans]
MSSGPPLEGPWQLAAFPDGYEDVSRPPPGAEPLDFGWYNRGPASHVQSNNHVTLRSQCGACGLLFTIGEDVTALICTRAASRSLAVKIPFPDVRREVSDGQRRFCRVYECIDCEFSPESATVHTRCYNFYMKHATAADKQRRLYIYACCVSPWPRCPPLELKPRFNQDRVGQLTRQMCFERVPEIATLPGEISDMIVSESETDELRSMAAVLDVIDFIDKAPENTMLAVPLREIVSWVRRSDPITGPPASPYDMRLTIDSKGILGIDRKMPDDPPFIVRDDHYAYAHYRVPPLMAGHPGVMAYFMFGMCRLVSRNVIFQPWDIPTHLSIPILDHSPDYWTLHLPYQVYEELYMHRVATIQLGAVTGITFFYRDNQTIGIHGHTASSPTAVDTYRKLRPIERATCVWVYVPLPHADTITAFGVRANPDNVRELKPNYRPCYLMRTTLMGDFTFGPYNFPPFHQEVVLSASRDSTLIHTVSKLSTRRPLVTLSTVLGLNPFHLLDTSDYTFAQPTTKSPIPSACYSRASLEDVARVHVFRGPLPDRLLRGLLFEYHNGGQRAVGECRLGHVAAEVCSDLASLGFTSARRMDVAAGKFYKGVVASTALPRLEPGERDPDPMWDRCTGGHTVEMWFSDKEAVLIVLR